ncbi:MAG: M1 family metallopeptidase [Thermonemataceae bacterium]
MRKILLSMACLFWLHTSYAQYKSDKFEQLGTELPTPNVYRTADGSPGHKYWQQKADYVIKVALHDENQYIKASETITYYNYPPNTLSYLWLQLDQNRFKKESDTYSTQAFDFDGKPNFSYFSWQAGVNSKGGYTISNVKDGKGKSLNYTINKTMMRIELPEPLKANGGSFTFSLDWAFNINDANKMGARGGYEYFPKDDNYLYEMAQWFPRMCSYNDVYGWQNKQFLGRGEFALTFGDYEVAITAPADHVVASTGVLQNRKEVLSATEMDRWEKAQNATTPQLIVTQEEAVAKEQAKTKPKKTKTWIYKAENVRDFAWASSRKFIWDAMPVEVGGKKVWAMSYYPKEGNPLWGAKSTNVVAHTLDVYSKYTFDYPYPVAISVHGPVFGMEYPMICFNGGRPEADGTVPDRTKYAMISVIIHEVGHNYFPMIVNSDERQWTWMDEGLNSFLQYRTEVELAGKSWTSDVANPYPSRRGPAKNIVRYMQSDPETMVPIMTNSEQVLQFGNNAYGKPATALSILRETFFVNELFDYAFKSYAQKWKFKHPEPADFFRTMEDASSVDLDWFWRGWFYTTEACDIALKEVKAYRSTEASGDKAVFATTSLDTDGFKKFFDLVKERAGIALSEEEEKIMLGSEGSYFYSLKFENKGGLVMPVILEMNFADGTKRVDRIPAELWRKSPKEVNKLFVTDKEVVSFVIDPNEETADIDTSNNALPREAANTEFDKK